MTIDQILSVIGAVFVLGASLLELWLERALNDIRQGIHSSRQEEKLDWIFWLLAELYSKDSSTATKVSIANNFDSARKIFEPPGESLAEVQHKWISRFRISIQMIGGALVIIGTFMKTN